MTETDKSKTDLAREDRTTEKKNKHYSTYSRVHMLQYMFISVSELDTEIKEPGW